MGALPGGCRLFDSASPGPATHWGPSWSPRCSAARDTHLVGCSAPIRALRASTCGSGAPSLGAKRGVVGPLQTRSTRPVAFPGLRWGWGWERRRPVAWGWKPRFKTHLWRWRTVVALLSSHTPRRLRSPAPTERTRG